MMGFEMMLSNMIGMKPDELKKAVQTTIATIEKAAMDMNEIKREVAEIKAMIEKKEQTNGRRKSINGSESHNSAGE